MSRIVHLVARRAAAGLLALAAMLMLALAADARDLTGRRTRSVERRPSLFDLGAEATFLLNFNEWLCGLHQIGEVCTSAVGSSVGGGGFWPSGTANQYIFNSGLQIAGIVGPDGGPWARDTVGTFFFNASGPGHGAPVSPIYASSNLNDLATWPDDCYIDSPVFGRVKTLSELDTCVQYWDANPGSTFPGSHPMGILVTQHSMLWSFPNNKDIIFFIYRFTNATNRPEFKALNPSVPASGYTLTNVYAAFAMDPDVSGAEYSENFASAVPDLNMAVAWQYDFQAADFVPYAPNFDAAPGFVGVKFLKSPINNSDSTITVRIGNQVRSVRSGQELGMTFFSVFTNPGSAAPMPDADNAKQSFRYLSGRLNAQEQRDYCAGAPPGMCYVNLAGPADMRFYESSGPFTLRPGQSAEIVVAYIAGAPVPGTYLKGRVISVGNVADTTRAIEKVMGRGFVKPGFPSLFQNAKTAQAIYDANFVLPSSPPGPKVTVLAGDKENTVIWAADPVTGTDPYAKLAQDPKSSLYDPNFRSRDFEGFRVYRKSNPSADWKLIGQYDVANGIAEVVTVQETVITQDGSELIIKADTARVCSPDAAGCTAETGLKFALVDRGGDFPNPSAGPGLTNGLRYYYAATSFDINSPQSGPSSLESSKVLALEASGVPRSTGAGRVALKVSAPQIAGGDGRPLDLSRTVTLDPDKGTFSGPQPPTNGFTVEFLPYDELLIPAGELAATIDSVVPLNGYEDLLGIHTQSAPNALGASLAYFLTVKTPSGTTKVRKEVTAPFGFFGAPETIDEEVFNAPLPSDAAKAQQLGLRSDHFSSALTARMNYGSDGLNSASEAVTSYRVHAIGSDGGSRWFVGSEPANPTLDTNAGQLPGVKKIINLQNQYVRNASVRWLVYLLSGLTRAADYEVTWGDNGTITRVTDLTHNVEVPFHEGYRGSWGVRNDASGDGIVSIGDFWLATPVSEWWCEEPGCHTPLEKQAKLSPLSSAPPSGFGINVRSSDGKGFGLYLAGEMFLFDLDQLPASGTKWILRTYSGEVARNEAGKYEFTPTARRPATVTGLTAKVTVESPTTFNLAEASLDKIHTVPDPYLVTSKLENSPNQKRLLFVNLPPQAMVRIYTLSGVLVMALEHDDPSGGGALEWDLRNRNNQFVASGVYFYHVETPDGRQKIGKFTIVQYAQ
ncbi:MAG: hypothetical protein HY704_02805 [Gemmatimonadetes bacterium]|nr:hypothetical protein [Gemmatimonadota bacterium]